MRIDAGFVQGDEVSSHYDPMIAKLIVSGPDRKAALQKLAAALEQYEIACPVTNIEFLKTVCRRQAFIDGEVETGYIQKFHSELFKKHEVEPETWAQAAIGFCQLWISLQAGRSVWADVAAWGFLVGHETLFLHESAGADMVRVSLIVFVQNGMNHDCLTMNGQDRVRWDIDPVL